MSDTNDLNDNRTVIGAFYQAAIQALSTLRWLESLDPKTNLQSDILLLERAVKMAEDATREDT